MGLHVSNPICGMLPSIFGTLAAFFMTGLGALELESCLFVAVPDISYGLWGINLQQMNRSLKNFIMFMYFLLKVDKNHRFLSSVDLSLFINYTFYLISLFLDSYFHKNFIQYLWVQDVY